MIGIEVKADAAPDSSSARHLLWLRDELGDRFEAGIVLHTGPKVYELGASVVAAPICTLWAQPRPSERENYPANGPGSPRLRRTPSVH